MPRTYVKKPSMKKVVASPKADTQATAREAVKDAVRIARKARVNGTLMVQVPTDRAPAPLDPRAPLTPAELDTLLYLVETSADTTDDLSELDTPVNIPAGRRSFDMYRTVRVLDIRGLVRMEPDISHESPVDAHAHPALYTWKVSPTPAGIARANTEIHRRARLAKAQQGTYWGPQA